MLELSAEQLAQRAFGFNLLDERQLADVWGQLGTRNVSPDELKQVLLRRELLTGFQIEKVLRGEQSGYFFGPFKVLYVIGSGTFARVYRAVNKNSGEVMAVKVLRTRFCEKQDNRDNFLLEGEMGRQLRHENIVPIFEVATEGKQPYLVMEFVEGRNLREFIKIRKRFEPGDAVKLAADIARGLDYAFKKGIQHRDLKTSNVLVSSQGMAKLVDFGLAAADQDLSDESLADVDNPRTIDYAALERLSGVKKEDKRSDIFFLGGILYHMLCGLPALSETTDRIQRFSRSRFNSIVPLQQQAADLPRALVAIVDKAMEFNPRLRYQTPAEMLADLKMFSVRLANRQPLDASVPAAARQRVLMVVESNPKLQDILRERLKQSGFRVLVTSDPRRPYQFFSDQDSPADCVIFGANDLGVEALEAFNSFGLDKRTEKVPAILLLGEKQLEWQEKARLTEQRVSISMPLRLKELRALLDRLVPEQKPAETAKA